MTKVVINGDYGGFGLSIEAAEHLGFEVTDDDRRFGYFTLPYNEDRNYRTNPDLVKLIEEWGSKSVSGEYATLKVVEVPDDVEWEIQEVSGREWVAEKHRVWE